ncbi:hypothetical protein FSP39_021033 [Pinctada imbricata]|uniref:Uncharacterized protein n=1 Tax=Pinctada imbricata TaxID=66713 RepID=A0AA88Y5P3_PINIB|nr:hypothetical protein FSP39_021033 [Pinctada imbricata]
MSEKIGGAKGTELDDDFLEMERKIDVLGKLIDDLISKTQEFLQPNPASRAKLMAVNSISKIRGHAKNATYPQPEGTLGEHMIKHGKDLGEDMLFSACLLDAGEVFKQIAEHKYSLEDRVKQDFLGPLADLHEKDLKEVNHHRKKLSGRRLDYDCKSRKKQKGSNISEEEIREAESKFQDSKFTAESAMHNVLENEVEQIGQLKAFIEAEEEYHRSAADLLRSLIDNIEDKRNEALHRPKKELSPKRFSFSRNSSGSNHLYDSAENVGDKSGSYSFNSSPQYSREKKEPCCEALYDFDPENEGELGFVEGQIIKLISQIDENWYEGSLNGQSGYFPCNYVKILVDLP